MMLLKKTEYNSLKTKVDTIDTAKFVLKTKYEEDGSDFEDKISKIDKKYLMLVTWLLVIWLKKQILMLKLLK